MSVEDVGCITEGSGSWLEAGRGAGAIGVASEADRGMMRQQSVARSDPFASFALGASQREQASVRDGAFILQSICPARAGVA